MALIRAFYNSIKSQRHRPRIFGTLIIISLLICSCKTQQASHEVSTNIETATPTEFAKQRTTTSEQDGSDTIRNGESGSMIDLPSNKENLWVFLMAGQSNMAGRGKVEPQDTLTSNRIFTINKNDQIVLAKEPIHFYEPTRTGLDCGLSFGKALLEHIPDSTSILIIPTAVGGSSISTWLNDVPHRKVRLMTNFTEKSELVMNYGVLKAILWHQGESDATPDRIADYEASLAKVMAQFRSIVHNDTLPVILGQLGAFKKDMATKARWNAINTVIKSYSENNKNTYLINTQDLSDRGDDLHFNSESQRVMGVRYARKYLELVE